MANDPILYLSAADVRALNIDPDLARTTMRRAYERHAEGLSDSLKKGSLYLGPGHGFQTMVAADSGAGIATVKWVAMAPTVHGSGRAGINGLIVVSDYVTGEPVAMMDGNLITLLRTAAMSAVAASLQIVDAPHSIGFIGCGMQALAHVDAFCALYPSLQHVYAFNLNKAPAERLVAYAKGKGVDGVAVESYEDVLKDADIVISTVPGGPNLVPFLDANKLRKNAFVSAVDLGRSWLPESFPAFQWLVTDSLSQGNAPWDVNSEPVTTATFNADLTQMIGQKLAPAEGRQLFCFKGYALADLALADLVYRLAQDQDIGLRLPR